MGRKVAINRGGGGLARIFFKGGALLEEASAFKTYFGPGPRPARVAINLTGFINQELTLVGKASASLWKVLGSSSLRIKQEMCRDSRGFLVVPKCYIRLRNVRDSGEGMWLSKHKVRPYFELEMQCKAKRSTHCSVWHALTTMVVTLYNSTWT